MGILQVCLWLTGLGEGGGGTGALHYHPLCAMHPSWARTHIILDWATCGKCLKRKCFEVFGF